MRRLFEGGACLKIEREKEIFSFNLKVYLFLYENFTVTILTELRIARILDRELNGPAVKHNQFELKNIAFDEKKFPMLF